MIWLYQWIAFPRQFQGNMEHCSQRVSTTWLQRAELELKLLIFAIAAEMNMWWIFMIGY